MCKTSASASAVFPKCCRLAGCTGRRRLISVAGFGLIVVSLPAGGCGSGSVMELKSSEQFRQQILQARKPAMIHFLKDGCSRCWLLESVMDNLASDYRDRAVFAKYHLMNSLWIVTNKELESEYGIGVYPTVVLFVNGQEKKRWLMHYDIESYRKALDEALSMPTRQVTRVPVASSPYKTRVPSQERPRGNDVVSRTAAVRR